MSLGLEHPVVRGVVLAAAAVLLLAPLAIAALGAAGRIAPALAREMLLRTRTWALLAPCLVGPVLLGRSATVAAVLLLSLLCWREFARATGAFRERLVSMIVVLGIAAVAFASLDHWLGFFLALPPLVIAVLAAVPIAADRPQGYIQRVALGAFGFMLFGAGLGHLGFLANDAAARPLLLTLLASVALSDVSAFVFGKTFGRRKLAPNTSPNKTVAGAVGSLLTTTAVAALLFGPTFRGSALDSWPHRLALGLLVAVGAQLGDLTLSSIKRDIGIKDIGAALAGHGGVLDRFNSLLLVAPAVFHYVHYARGVGAGEPVRVLSGGP